MPTTRTAAAGDALALSLSGLCFIHCVILPPLAVALPLLGAFAEAEWIHWLFAALAAPLSAWTLTRPPRRSRSPLALSLAAAGVGVLLAGAAGWPKESLETALTVAGGLLLAAAHVLNLRRRGGACHAG